MFKQNFVKPQVNPMDDPKLNSASIYRDPKETLIRLGQYSSKTKIRLRHASDATLLLVYIDNNRSLFGSY